MNILIDNKQKMEKFVYLFQLLKNWSNHLNFICDNNLLNIQCMDKSHVCLANININATWFSEYKLTGKQMFSLNSNNLSLILNYALRHDILVIKLDDNEDEHEKIYLNLLNNKENKSSFDNYFELSLLDNEVECIGIPNVDYDLELKVDSKKMVDVLTQLNIFSSDLRIISNDDYIEFISNGDQGSLKISINIDDLNEYSITEDETINLIFSLNHICKLCCSNKLSELMEISINKSYPMIINYDLGENSNVSFYIAPKISE
jgi:proliferating cell nuclear antigen PCNA